MTSLPGCCPAGRNNVWPWHGLLTAPDLLLMDEATANLDPASVHIIETSLKTAAQQGMKIIVVTHDVGQPAAWPVMCFSAMAG